LFWPTVLFLGLRWRRERTPVRAAAAEDLPATT
jgi:hypothetical protein